MLPFAGVFLGPGTNLPEDIAKSLAQFSGRSALPIHNLPQATVVAPAGSLHRDAESLFFLTGDFHLQAEKCTGGEFLSSEWRTASDHCLRRINGAFVAARFQYANCQWSFARDPLGVSQCVVHIAPKGAWCAFASDLPTLLALLPPAVQKEVDPEALASYFALGYIPAPRTIYRKCRKVPAATVYTGRLGEASGTTLRQWWQPDFAESSSLTPQETQERAKMVIHQAMERLFQRYPQVDALLSGGIDSGTVTGLAKATFPQVVGKAHTISFGIDAYDESPIAAGTATKCGVPLTIRQVDHTDMPLLDSLIAAAGEPYADSSLLATAVAVRQSTAPAVIMGDGGDELFGGYRRYRAMALRQGLPQWLITILAPFMDIGAMVLGAPKDNRTRLANLLRSMKALALPELAAYGSFMEIFPEEMRRQILCDQMIGNYLDDWVTLLNQAKPSIAAPHIFNAIDLAGYLPDDGCRKSHYASAGTGVTCLAPLMDMDVASFALAQPPRRRFAGSHSKPILREIGAPYLDPRALNATKRGFGMPISYWFRGPMAQQILELARSAHEWDHLQLLNHRYLEELAVQHTAGYANHDARLWSIWCLRIWEKSLPQ